MRNLNWYIDIGNSSISVGREMDGKLSFFYEFKEDSIPKLCKIISYCGIKYENKVVMCSVVPKIEKLVCDRLRHYKILNYLVLGKHLPIRIASKYASFKQLGNDRKANVYGALGRWKPPFLIIDFGTATTIDYVSANRVFEGGLIIPGIKSCLDLLHEKTALLPPVRIKPVPYFLGRSTKAGMLSGVLNGYGAMVDGLVREFKSRYGTNLKTIGTGGLVDIVGKYCGGFDHADPMLTLQGIRDVYQDWCSSGPKGLSKWRLKKNHG